MFHAALRKHRVCVLRVEVCARRKPRAMDMQVGARFNGTLRGFRRMAGVTSADVIQADDGLDL